MMQIKYINENIDFVYICDVHYGGQPISRKDNYNDSILNKLKQVFDYALEKGCRVVIGGDLFDSPRLKMEEFIKIVNLFSFYNTLEFYILYGNYSHDGHPDNSPLSIIKTLRNVYLNCHIVSNDFILLFCPNGSSALVVEEEFMEKYRSLRREHLNGIELPERKVVLFTHDTIVKTPVVFEHTLFEDFKTMADYVFLSHYHPYQGLSHVNGRVFYGCGALSRRKRIAHDMNRKLVFAKFANGVIDEIPIECETDIWTNREFKNDVDFDVDLLKHIEVIKRETAYDELIRHSSIEDLLKEYAKLQIGNLEPKIFEFIFKKIGEMGK